MKYDHYFDRIQWNGVCFEDSWGQCSYFNMINDSETEQYFFDGHLVQKRGGWCKDADEDQVETWFRCQP